MLRLFRLCNHRGDNSSPSDGGGNRAGVCGVVPILRFSAQVEGSCNYQRLQRRVVRDRIDKRLHCLQSPAVPPDHNVPCKRRHHEFTLKRFRMELVKIHLEPKVGMFAPPINLLIELKHKPISAGQRGAFHLHHFSGFAVGIFAEPAELPGNRPQIGGVGIFQDVSSAEEPGLREREENRIVLASELVDTLDLGASINLVGVFPASLAMKRTAIRDDRKGVRKGCEAHQQCGEEAKRKHGGQLHVAVISSFHMGQKWRRYCEECHCLTKSPANQRALALLI